MKNHGLRRIFSLFLALFMVFTLLPTTALAEDTTGADENQPKTVVVDEGEKKTDPPAQEQPKNENPPAPEEPKTFTVTYTDGADGAVFADKVYSNLSSGTPTPAFDGTLAREGYTFAGWNPHRCGNRDCGCHLCRPMGGGQDQSKKSDLADDSRTRCRSRRFGHRA